MVHFGEVAIIGVGLIGGSLAKVMKVNGIADRITGAGRGREGLELALRLGVIDRIADSLEEAVGDADLVVLATPVGVFEQITKRIGMVMKPGAILTDVGSVKGEMVNTLESILPGHVRYVPGHPIAGKEKTGVAESSDTLFKNAKCILTPTEKTDRAALDAVRGIWEAAGAKVIIMDPFLHDKVFAAVSHLPHVAAYAMMCAVSDMNTGTDDYLAFSGAGFRDFTRIAASSPEMWRDVCLLNKKNIVHMIERYQFSLSKLKKAIEKADAGTIEKIFKQASDIRKGLGASR